MSKSKPPKGMMRAMKRYLDKAKGHDLLCRFSFEGKEKVAMYKKGYILLFFDDYGTLWLVSDGIAALLSEEDRMNLLEVFEHAANRSD